MERQTPTPGPEIGWAFGLAGFAVSVFVGWLIAAGIGFVLFMVVLWGGLGALFAFLVERSSIEERDRIEELRTTRLATMRPLAAPVEVVPELDGAPGVAARGRETAEERRARRAAAREAADEVAAAHASRMAGGPVPADRPVSSRRADAPVADEAPDAPVPDTAAA